MKRKTLWILTALVLVALFSCGGKSALDAFTVPAEASLWDFFKSKTAKAVELRTAEDLEELRKNPEGSFVLAEDISLDYVPFSAIESFNGTLTARGTGSTDLPRKWAATPSPACSTPWEARLW